MGTPPSNMPQETPSRQDAGTPTADGRPCSRCGARLGTDGGCPCCELALALGTSTGPTPEDQAPPFTRRFGVYELAEELGHGGMGVVYRAWHVQLRRWVALKMLLLGRFSSDEAIERFRREARSVAALRHPNIVTLLEIGEVDRQHYFTMELVEGRSLATCLREGPLPPRRAAECLRDVARAVQAAHEAGIVHRDLKPSNILVDSNDHPRITDFGLAKPLDGSGDLTFTAQMLGSPNYLAPELTGGRGKPAGPGTDLYALGAVCYECLTGRPPFLAATLPETLMRVRDTEPVPPRFLNPAVSRDLETICLKCLEKEPARRYATARELADEFDRFLRGDLIHARPVRRAARAWRWCRRNRAVTVGAALVVVLVTGFSWHNWRTLTELRDTAPSLIALAEFLMTGQKFPEALERVEVAIRLQPRNAEYRSLKADILLALLRVEEARESYLAALDLDARTSRARMGVEHCDRLLAARLPNGDWPPEAIEGLHRDLIEQGRSPEAHAVFRHLDARQVRDLEFYQKRLSAAGITNELRWILTRPTGLGLPVRRQDSTRTHDSIRYLDLASEQSTITTLEPLRGIPLNILSLNQCNGLVDLTPLQGMPLIRLKLVQTGVSDLSSLASLPLEFLWIGFTRVRDLSALRSVPTLRTLYLHNVDIFDLSPLRGSALDHLELGSLPITSLEPIRGMPLTNFELRWCNVTDLGPLADSPITNLRLYRLNITNLGPVGRLPLRFLQLNDCPLLLDLSPLEHCTTLEKLVLPPNARDIAFLRELPNLKEISYSESLIPADEFWKAYDANQRLR